ncbi:NAD(P)/FAD-dependent oxidoreductase [Paenibacillus sp. N1-5-1-14]|uniref:NAD(P)/FAD-dependent oxidoreductase n=1 Tax=Paenibacillus radicibacter TaxID=2972488 RepID=UPI0021591AEB|nr:NAD(P)/FAD-dependent oxidoreductase [Paenibacillus radicibacter]MCR8641113.1 NAD(P)/FAD-dependent oxidoreductase [Paenibacillus radicibacter]
MDTKLWDVVIIGGGPAGLSAALVLGRSMRQVVVIDAGQPRNAVTQASHGYLTRDGIHPLEFKRIAMEELHRYKSIQIVKGYAESAQISEYIFTVKIKGGEVYNGRKLIVATGVQDHLPDIEGLKEAYGSTVFPCPYCDGYEHQDAAIALFGNGKGLKHYVPLIHHWNKDIVVFTNGRAELEEGLRAQMEARQIRIVEEPIGKLVVDEKQLQGVLLNSGEMVARTAGYIMDTGVKLHTSIPEKFGVQLDDKGHFATNSKGLTAVDGLYIIGDAKHLFNGLICAASDGYEAGEAINQLFIEEEWGMSDD